MNLDAKVAKNVRKLLRAKKITAERLAYEIDLSKGYLSNFLNGKSGASLKTVQRLAKGLDVPVAKLILG